MSNKSIPKETFLRKCKDQFSWLKIIDVGGENKMIYKVFTSQEEKLKLMPNTNLTFIKGSTNFKKSSLSDHETTDEHKSGIREQENEKATVAGLTVTPCKVVQETQTYSAIADFKRMGETKKTALKKLFDIAHHIATKGQPFTEFKDTSNSKKIMESNFNLVHMEMKVVVAISSKPSEFFFKKIYTRKFYE